MAARLETSGLLQSEGKIIEGKCTPLTVSMMQQESVKTSCAKNLEGSGVDNFTLACIVCYTQVTIAEYKDYEYSMCVIEMQKEDDTDSYLTLPCCSRLICKACMQGIIATTVNEARSDIVCPHPECGESFTTDYVNDQLNDQGQLKLKYRKLLVDKNDNGKIKTCPNCSHFTEHKQAKRFKAKEVDLKVTCEVCQHEWCFSCHAPWHTGKSCKEFKTGNADFKKWSKSVYHGIPNCQKCPTCRVYIQRSTGCPHMTCNRCGTEFCYHCGGRYLDLGIIEHEYDPLSVWGCPRIYHPDNPCLRNTVRWGYLFAKISYLIAYPFVFVLALAAFMILLMVCVPCYCCCKICSICCYNSDLKKSRANRSRGYMNV